MSKYTEALEEMNLNDFAQTRDLEVMFMTKKSERIIRNALGEREEKR